MTIDELNRQTMHELLVTDSLADMLERRIVALEAVVATPWPWRIAAAWRLGRAIRRPAAGFAWAGPDFGDRRGEAMGNEWLSR